MLVYHFLNKKYGLENLKLRRLKISRMSDLNDPFEFMGVSISERTQRLGWQRTIDELDKDRGLLCFSSNWHNPVMWSHYADRHGGVCLGLEIPDENLTKVSYVRDRLKVSASQLGVSDSDDEKLALALLSTKFAHWKYESEYRSFLALAEPEGDKYFTYFSEVLQLREVIVGALSTISRKEVTDALGDQGAGILRFKARLAFKSFDVVRNENSRLWQ